MNIGPQSSNQVTLTESEMKFLSWVGQRRYENAMLHNRHPGEASHKLKAGAGFHILGAMGEFAASVIVNRSWRLTIGEIDQPDVGGFIEVRTVDNPNYTLLIKPKDHDRPFMLMQFMGMTTFRCPGWYHARDAKDEFALTTQTRDATHKVPRIRLRPVDELRAMQPPDSE